MVFFGALIAVPYWFYKLGARADRGTVLIVLDESAPDSLRREASQAAGVAPTLRYGPVESWCLRYAWAAGDSAPRPRLR